MRIFCALCKAGYSSCGEVPRVCPDCKRETAWRSAPFTEPEPLDPSLNANDRRFLRSLRITWD